MSGRLWRAALDPDLAAAAPVLGAQHGRGLKWNREADVRGELGGRAGSHVWVGLGAGSQPGRAAERPRRRAQPENPQVDLPTSSRTPKGQPRATMPSDLKSPGESHQRDSSRPPISSSVKCGGYPQGRLALILHLYFPVPRTSGT